MERIGNGMQTRDAQLVEYAGLHSRSLWITVCCLTGSFNSNFVHIS